MMTSASKLIDFFFSPYGRVPRLDYIAFVLVSWALSAAAFWFMGEFWAVPVGIFLTFPAICLGIRRWHDFNFRGWWLLLRFALLPLLWVVFLPAVYLAAQVLPLFVLAVEFIVPGTPGANRFGPQPRGLWSCFANNRRPALPAARHFPTYAKPARAKKAPLKAKAPAKRAKRK